VKNWIFDDLIHKELPVLVILVPVMDDQTIRISKFFGKILALEASEVADAAEVNEVGKVSKAWKITTVNFRVFQVLEFNIFWTNIILF
jgi:hypothetical protein